MRKQFLTVLLPVLVVVLITASAQTQSAGTDAPKHAALQKVSVVRTSDGFSVEISARGTVKPRLSTLDSPARIVVDLPNTVVATSRGLISVDGDGVKDVRLGMDGQGSSRVVVDLTKACRHELVAGSDNTLVLKLYTKSVVAQTSQPAVVKAPAVQPVVAKSDVVAAPVAPVAPVVAELVAPAKEAKLIQTSAHATDFAFIEPSYSPKAASDDTKAAAIEPPARAITAAGKFVSRPDGNLLPPASAAMQSSGVQPAVNMAAEQKAQASQQPAITGPKYTGEPISVNLKDVDLKDFFRLIHEISGLNVVLDPNVKGTLTIVLDDVPWDQALDIVLKNNDLSRQLEGNVLRIATVETMRKEAESRRAQVEAEALAVDKVTVTRFLSYAHSKDVVPTVKNFLTQRGDVISDDRTNALIIQDIPSVMPSIDRLLTQLDRKTQEVEIEARVVAATRSFARDIGTQLGFGWGNGTSAVGGASAVGTSPTSVFGLSPLYPIIGTSVPSPTTGQQIPLFSNLPVTSPNSGISFLNASNNVRIDAVLTMAESRGLLKILSRPRVVTQNNIQALVRQGVRVPIVTQAQLGGPPTVTYVDAFLRLTVVPQITSEGTIFLNVDVENTTPDFGRTVQGNPTLITQQATTQVLVTDGGTVVIGGVIQTQNSVNISQVPLLGNIPYLGNLFKRQSVSTSNQELIFFITPRIIQT
jgi:type IV pilus assembly protein PilQ